MDQSTDDHEDDDDRDRNTYRRIDVEQEAVQDDAQDQRTRLSQLTLSAVWSCLRMKKSDKRMAVIGAKTEPMR